MDSKQENPLPNSINIVARRWFEKVNGNTYFKGEIWIDGKPTLEMPYQYGYGDHWLDVARQMLNESGIIREKVRIRTLPDGSTHTQGYEGLFREYCEDNNITLYKSVSDVTRKKDL